MEQTKEKKIVTPKDLKMLGVAKLGMIKQIKS